MKGQYGTERILPKCRAKISIPDIQKTYDKCSSKSIVALQSKEHTKPIELSVIIPLFRAKFIGWVPFEALVRQKGIEFGWELVVMEEDFDNPFSLHNITQYSQKLKNVGCVRIVYIAMSNWIPLSAKWFYLIHNISASTKVIMCNSADNYFSPHRMRHQFETLKDNHYNWYKIMGNVTYDIASRKHAKRILSDSNRKDTSGKAMHISLARELPLANVKRGVDGWTHNTLSQTRHGFRPYTDYSDIWKETVNITGLNNLSLKQGKRVVACRPPLSFCCHSMKNHMPEEVVAKLVLASQHLEAHQKILSNSPIRL